MNVQIAIAIKKCVAALLANADLRRATFYLAVDMTIKATRQRKFDRRDRQETYLITFGRPNYAERKFIKWCKEVGEPFPVPRVQLTYWPEPKRKQKKAA